MSGEAVYTVTWRDKGKPKSESFTDYLSAEGRARALSMERQGAVYIESRVRYVHARFERGAQTLAYSYALTGGLTEP